MSQPNILFFFTDDQRFDTINALGCPDARTPTLDALAQRGTSFTHATIMGGTSAAVCMPSRAMLMTGRSLFHLERQGGGIPSEHALLGETLREAGYTTFGIGKWHNGTESYARSFTGGAEIFFGGMDDHWNVPACDFDPAGDYPQRISQTVDFRSQRVGTKIADHIHAGRHSSELFCDAAVRMLDTYDGDNPFYMYVSFMAPHDPRTMPEQYRRMFDPERLTLPPNLLPRHPFDNGELEIRDELLEAWPRTLEAVRRHLAAYYAMIAHADAQIARVLEALERSGRADDTIIVFAGDNGLAVGQHGLMGKQSLYEHSIRVPLIFAGPGIPAGERRDCLCTLYDLFPTLCELSGVPIPDSVDGLSLLPSLRDPRHAHREDLYLAYRHLHRGVRNSRYKLVEYAVEGQRTTQLFDLETDPYETTNLAQAAEHAETVRSLRTRMAELRAEHEDTREAEAAFWDSAGSEDWA